jgi:hypothetical protein
VFYGTRGLTFYTVDGGDINNVTVSNISMRGTYGVICLRLGSRMRPYAIPEEKRPKTAGNLRNVMISNVQAVGVTESNCFISGIPGHPIENVTLDKIRIEYQGGGKETDYKRVIPESEGEYPKPRMFGTLPAYGLYIRHARNLKLLDLEFTWRYADERPVLFCDDVEGMEMRGLRADASQAGSPFIHLDDCRDAVISGARPVGPVNTFVQVEGSRSQTIALLQNDFSRVKEPVDLSRDLPKNTVLSRYNYSH